MLAISWVGCPDLYCKARRSAVASASRWPSCMLRPSHRPLYPCSTADSRWLKHLSFSMLLPPKLGKGENERPPQGTRDPTPFPPPHSIPALDSWVYRPAGKEPVPLRAQHAWPLPLKLLCLGFHKARLGGKGLSAERSKHLSAGITPEAPEQGVSQGEGVLS